MVGARQPAALAALATMAAGLALLLPAPSAADHVTASPSVSARLGEPVGSRSWEVVVDWSISCSGAVAPTYGGNLYLVDTVSGEETYLGGTLSASGQTTQIVGRKSTPRYLQPRIKAYCSSSVTPLHGSDTLEASGAVVSVPPLDQGGSGHGSGARGAQGGRDFPGSGFGGPVDPLGQGGCAHSRQGTPGDDTLNGGPAGDLIFGLGGDDLIRGRAGSDCLVGDTGRDRLRGGAGGDRLTGGSGADVLAGNGGVNRYDAGAGNDFVSAANGRSELVSCGSGRDRARVDGSDRVRGCEQVTKG